MTTVPERWEASWENDLAVTRMAGAHGWEFTPPIARWHGCHGATDTQGSTLETLAWAAALLATTGQIVVFGTLHVPLINPVFAAKQIATADLVGHGRSGRPVVMRLGGAGSGETGKTAHRLTLHAPWLTGGGKQKGDRPWPSMT